MGTYVLRRLLRGVAVYLGIVLVLMAALRVDDPVPARLGMHATSEANAALRAALGLDRPFLAQYIEFLGEIARLDFDAESFDYAGKSVGSMLAESIPPTLAITVPAFVLSTALALLLALAAAASRARLFDRTLTIVAVLGTSISFPVYVILGQHFGATALEVAPGEALFAAAGYEPGLANWPRFCLLPVLICTVAAVGFDLRFYRAVLVEEARRDYAFAAQAKGAGARRILLVHVLKNAGVPILTHAMSTLPFVVTGSFVLEVAFNIPGMGRTLYGAIQSADFPVTQAFGAVFAALFLLSHVATDLSVALVDPRVRRA